MLNEWLSFAEETLKAAKEQEMLENEMMPKSKGLFKKSRKTSQVLTTRGMWQKTVCLFLYLAAYQQLYSKDIQSKGCNNGPALAFKLCGENCVFNTLRYTQTYSQIRVNDTHHPGKLSICSLK